MFFNLTVGDKTVVYPTSDIYALTIPWDTGNIRNSLESSMDTILSEDAIRGQNDSLASISTDLTLPSCIRGGKYSFAWITWESSDEAHLAVNDENRQGSADALYNPFTGTVYQDHAEHVVTLTATATNPSTEVTVTRDFEVTIAPLSDDVLNQNLDMMTSILKCYTADKLENFATGEPLNTAAVDGDIQLVIPARVVTPEDLAGLDYGKYWDYWNYKFTVSSSDTDVIEINSFRAYVYRPVGEDSSADRQVTLTVKMTSKANPNLFVTKDIPVTVKHLDRAELNEALALMDQAKTGYASGLLGGNTDAYSIIDNLAPFQEIVWNADHSGVEFIRRHADMQHSGIIVDALPGWEEQEDFRTFHTSSRDLISNETLIVNQTPDEDTFVKINSVLTDEVFGKYYTKFRDDAGYDAEALAKFRQLYQQPVSAYVMVVGEGNYDADFAAMPAVLKEFKYSAKLAAYKKELDKPISVTFTLLGLDGATLISRTTETSFTKGATVFDVFKKVLADHHISYTARGSYVSSVNGLAEFDHGSNSGWMYTVGSVYVNSYMNAQELSDGDDIVIRYVTDYTLANKKTDDPIEDPDSGNENPGGSNTGSNPGPDQPQDSGHATPETPGDAPAVGAPADAAQTDRTHIESKETAPHDDHEEPLLSGNADTGADLSDGGNTDANLPQVGNHDGNLPQVENHHDGAALNDAVSGTDFAPVVIISVSGIIFLGLIVLLLRLQKRKRN